MFVDQNSIILYHSVEPAVMATLSTHSMHFFGLELPAFLNYFYRKYLIDFVIQNLLAHIHELSKIDLKTLTVNMEILLIRCPKYLIK